MYPIIILLGLGAIYLTARGIQGQGYRLKRFLTDMTWACLGLIVVFMFAWLMGGA